MGDGGPPLRALEAIRRDYPLSIHAVGLSLGTAGPLDTVHLERLRRLVDRFEPGLVSEHLTWSMLHGSYLYDLLPLPYDAATLAHFVARVGQVQDTLGRPILIENPSGYVRFPETTMDEPDFLAELAQRSGCRLLLDVNNIVVSGHNLGFDPAAYLTRIRYDLVGEIHLAGHRLETHGNVTVRVDEHGSTVAPEVWDLYRSVLSQTGPVPTLIEWDNNVPALDELIAEARKADHILAAGIMHADVS